MYEYILFLIIRFYDYQKWITLNSLNICIYFKLWMKFTAVRIESKCPFSRKRKYLIRIKILNIVLMIYI